MGGIQYSPIDITGTGTRLLQGAGFRFYGTTYNSTVVSTNGNIQFGSNSVAYNYTSLPASGFGPTIFAYWHDLLFGGAPQGV